MKKRITFFLAFLMLSLAGMQTAVAQGFRVYKSDGTALPASSSSAPRISPSASSSPMQVISRGLTSTAEARLVPTGHLRSTLRQGKPTTTAPQAGLILLNLASMVTRFVPSLADRKRK